MTLEVGNRVKVIDPDTPTQVGEFGTVVEIVSGRYYKVKLDSTPQWVAWYEEDGLEVL